jgi:hypothetical protein
VRIGLGSCAPSSNLRQFVANKSIAARNCCSIKSLWYRSNVSSFGQAPSYHPYRLSRPDLEHLTEPSDLAEADEGATEGDKGEVDVGASLVAHHEATRTVQPGVRALHDQRCRPRRWLLSLPRRAMRGVMPRARHSGRQRRWS